MTCVGGWCDDEDPNRDRGWPSRNLPHSHVPYVASHVMPHTHVPYAAPLLLPGALGGVYLAPVCDSGGGNCRLRPISAAPPPPTYSATCMTAASNTCRVAPDPSACHVGARSAAQGTPPPFYPGDYHRNISAAMGYRNTMSTCGTTTDGWSHA